ncbi:TPA: DNA polymerase/3'-5' exonuclease PolX [Candidatus Woesearchaeota archaeon]|nr:MAG: DNA polymerase beta family [archaeon GW2011_AR11]HIH92460.1 DNA polymerase/3'-5' exonuclease PolX [Candidatus Woesearchaeota archaeon]HII64224.1 DNA polymerase/3'-5' exonuclease PolX [Candidatus Woesearchaeota archaeon]
MKNLEVAELLRNIAELLEIQEENSFKIRAYEKAALVIENLSEDIGKVWKEGRLEELPGIGEALAEKISEFLEKGRLAYYEKLKKEVPIDMENLGKIPGLGPKTLKKLYRALKIRDVPSLEKAARAGNIRNLPGLGAKAEENILKSLAFSKSATRIPLGFALPHAEEIVARLRPLKDVKRIDIAGSLRRRKDTIGDIDLLVASKNPAAAIGAFASLPLVEQVLAKGDTKSSVRLKEGIQVDMRVIDEKSYGAALIYFTGSKQHNIELRKAAISKGCKLSEYGLFSNRTNALIAGKTEQDLYESLGLPYIEPELRENEGEIEAARQHKLPRLIMERDVRGDLQMHSTWSDGSNTIGEMARAAQEMGHEYICITDHGGNLPIANALKGAQTKDYLKDIEKANNNIRGITVLKGMEANITKDGTIDVPNRILKQMDIVLGSIHSGFKNPKEEMTKRITKAMENEHVDIIAHPTGRLINQRPAYDTDFDALLDTAKSTGTVLEINASPERLDLDASHVRAAVQRGVKLSIGTDAHTAESLKSIRLGVFTARRGWAEKKDVINALPVKGMLAQLK